MLSRGIFWGAVAAGGLAMLMMLGVTIMWMTVPDRIIYQRSSPAWTEAYSIEVQEHGQSYFLTPDQKRTVDWVRSTTPIVWFGGFGTASLSILVGAAAWLKNGREP